MLASKSTSSSKSTTKPVKTLSTSISREEAKTPEIETVSESRKKSSTPQKKQKKSVSSTKANGPKSSPLSSRAQRIKQSLRNKIEVSAVILKEDGTSSEVKYNGSSKQSNVILGGRPSIIGEYEELGVVVVRSLNQSQSLNKTILPVPFCNKQYNGPYLLYRVDKLGNPTDLRVEEYTKFVSKNKGLTESARKNFNPIDDQQIKTKSNSLSSNTKLTLVYLRSEVDKKIRGEYEKKTGKKPSSADIEQEVNESVQKLVDELVSSSSPMNDPDYSPSEEDEVKGDDKAVIISKLKQVYKQENLGKDVNNKELLKSLENTKILLATEKNPDFDDERDWRLQLNDALNYVRERGRLDGRILAEKISETFYELNGAEPSLDELVDVFRRIKSELAEEAEQDLIEQGYDIKGGDKRDNGSAYYLAKKFGSDLSKAQPADIVDYAFRIVKEDWISRAKSVFKSTKGRLPNDNELQECVESLALKLASQAIDGTIVAYDEDVNNDYDSVADPDYDPNNASDKRQLKEDKEEDQFDSDYFNLRMLTTESSKSSKTGKSQTYDVYFCKFSEKREARNLEQAIQTFKLRNKREPNAVEISKIKQFISTKPANNLIQFKLAVVSDDDQDNDGLERNNEEKSDVLISRSSKGKSNKTGPTTPSKVLVTPVKKKKTSSRYNVYFGEDELDQKKSEQQALKWFKRFNHRKPNELELAGIKQFVNADKTQLKEVEYEVPVDLQGLIIGDDDRKETEEDDNSNRLKTLRFNEKDIIKKKNKSTKYTLNFDNEDERENGNEKSAIKWFKRFNNRSPNSEEIKSIKSFVQADADENTVDID